MPSYRSNALTALIFCLLASIPASAAVIHDELLDGDFSNDRTTATVLTLLPGHNYIYGETGQPIGGVTDREYFTFTVPQRGVVKSLIVFDSFVSGGNGAFVGLQAGDQVTVDPNAPDTGLLLGYAIVSPTDIGSDILPRMSTAAGTAIVLRPRNGGGQHV